MTTRDDTQPDVDAPEAEADVLEQAASEGPAGFRDKLKRTEDTRDRAQQAVRGAVLDKLGVSDGSGIAKAIDKAYEGDWTDIDGAVAWAREEFDGVFQTPDETRANELAAQEQRLSGIRTASDAVDADEYEARLDQQREEGNVRGSIQEQTQHFYKDLP